MTGSTLWPRVVLIIGTLCLVIGAFDPLEGSVVILLGAGIVSAGAAMTHSPHAKLLVWSFVLIAVGVGVLFGLSALGGLGGTTGRPLWWAVVLLPYPVGWVMALIGTYRWYRQIFNVSSSSSGGR
jgi:hypothetical protein